MYWQKHTAKELMYIMYFPTILGAPKKHHFLSKVIVLVSQVRTTKSVEKRRGKS